MAISVYCPHNISFFPRSDALPTLFLSRSGCRAGSMFAKLDIWFAIVNFHQKKLDQIHWAAAAAAAASGATTTTNSVELAFFLFAFSMNGFFCLCVVLCSSSFSFFFAIRSIFCTDKPREREKWCEGQQPFLPRLCLRLQFFFLHFIQSFGWFVHWIVCFFSLSFSLSIFQIISNRLGFISLDEFAEACDLLQKHLPEHDTKEELMEMCKLMDINKDSLVDLNEFLETFRLCEQERGNSFKSEVLAVHFDLPIDTAASAKSMADGKNGIANGEPATNNSTGNTAEN